MVIKSVAFLGFIATGRSCECTSEGALGPIEVDAQCFTALTATSSPEPESLWRKYPRQDEEVGLIEREEPDSLNIRHCTSGRSLCSTFLSLRLVLQLDGMGVDDCSN